METGCIILAAGVAVGIGMLLYKVTNRRKTLSQSRRPKPNNKPHTSKTNEKMLPPEFNDSEISSIMSLMKKLDAVYKKM